MLLWFLKWVAVLAHPAQLRKKLLRARAFQGQRAAMGFDGDNGFASGMFQDGDLAFPGQYFHVVFHYQSSPG
jgi:hypothetical protein